MWSIIIEGPKETLYEVSKFFLIYQLLKLGGILIVRDHEALEGVGKTATKTLHRIEPAAVIADFEAVGFKKVSEGDFLKNSQDAKEEHWNKLSTPAGFILKFIKM